jgi:hypothetical protein
LGNKSSWFKYGKKWFSRSGTQTAALAFGGAGPSLQEQQKNMTDQLGHQIQQD